MKNSFSAFFSEFVQPGPLHGAAPPLSKSCVATTAGVAETNSLLSRSASSRLGPGHSVESGGRGTFHRCMAATNPPVVRSTLTPSCGLLSFATGVSMTLPSDEPQEVVGPVDGPGRAGCEPK